MEHELDPVEVKIVSSEIVKPSLPPSSHPTTFTLSLVDQIFAPLHIPILLFYAPSDYLWSPGGGCGLDVDGLKTSLSRTLDKFYPLAGRLLDESTVSCDHQGVPFIETKINCDLSVVLSSPHKLNLLAKFLPSTESLGPQSIISELVPLAIQVNVFGCGGVVFGCYMFHKLLDAASFGTFFKYWSTLASLSCEDDAVVEPDFKATVKAFPPLPNTQDMVLPFHHLFKDKDDPPTTCSNTAAVMKSFVFDTSSISKLKAMVKSEQLGSNPTTFEVVVGFVWEQLLLAIACNLGAQLEHSALSIAVNMRPRMSPPLPEGSMGNLVTIARAVAQGNKTKTSGMLHRELVKEIHLALSEINKKITTVYQGKNAAEVILSETAADLRSASEYHEGIFRLTSWCRAGFSDADFGFGNPVWIVPIDGKQPLPILRNFITLTDYRHPITGDGGIEVWLCLEQEQMQHIASNPHFLAFASPN